MNKIKIEEFFFRIKDNIRDNLLYTAVWCIALSTILIVNFATSTTYKFVGVTDSKEVNINSKHAVVIKSINVISGQSVTKGQLLVELKREDLSLKVNEVSHKLEELNAQFKLNSELNAGIKSLKRFKKKSKRGKKKKIEKVEEDLISIQIRSLEKEIQLLHKEQEELYIFSTIDGDIGSVNYKVGESASPFDPIITMHKKTPTMVRGYIHENLSHKIEINKNVSITSMSEGKKIIAVVKSIGNRIIEFPERFRRGPDQKIWGREVMIQIPENNPFLLGEKVFMELTNDGNITIMNRTIADDEEIISKYDYNLIPIKKGELSDYLMEPSGLTYCKELNKYLMISDDNEHNSPLIFLLNRDGTVDSHVIQIEGLDEIKDMESIGKDDNGNMYVLSSQSPNKKRKVSKSRRKFVKLERNGINIKKVAEVELFTLLEDLAKKNKRAGWAKMLKPLSGRNKYSIEMDVEGMIIDNNDLYLGLRNPVGSRREVMIIKISNVNKMLTDNSLNSNQVSLFRMMNLPVNRSSDRHEGISDMLLRGDQLIIVTANNKKKNLGRVLSTKLVKNSPVVELKYFSDHRPEGITYDEMTNEYIVVFDNNREDAPLLMSTFTNNNY